MSRSTTFLGPAGHSQFALDIATKWDLLQIFNPYALLFVDTDTIFQAPFCPKYDAKWANNIQHIFCDAIS